MEQEMLKKDIIQKLRNDLLDWQGLHKPSTDTEPGIDAGPFASAFPNNTFPTAAVHELISYPTEDAAATNGFIAALCSQFLKEGKYCLWISSQRLIYPPALTAFGIKPHQVIFVDVHKQKEVLWAVEECLKCNSLAAVVGEVAEVDFTASRRLQLAVERSRVTAFIHRYQPQRENTLAVNCRWRVRPISSISKEGMPGMGYPTWEIQLEKVRNGQSGSWQIMCSESGLKLIKVISQQTASTHQVQIA